MNVIRISGWCMFATLAAIGTTVGLIQLSGAQQASAADQDGVEVLTRGPVHEAFAETIAFDPQPGIVAPQAPPAAIEEVPPQQRPEGNNLAWIPGYWAWDDERNDFLWLSGIWRALPPGRQWVPGYWDRSQQGSQWTSGYWADAAATEILYLPEPPATVKVGPNGAAPSADHMWLPGCWIWQQNRYAWRPGYWTQGHQGWDWVPDHYVWTPSGYIFVDGYYDYSVSRRGVVFAPVYFNSARRTQRGFAYTPSTVINPGAFLSHLFLRPSYGHYYFGDYYGSNYRSAGFSPWFSFHSSRRGYDPIYANQRWHHRHDGDWEDRAKANFRNFRDDENSRPPRTWAAQRELEADGAESNLNRVSVVTSLDELAGSKNRGQRFQPVDDAEQQKFSSRGREYRKFREQRQQLEANAAIESAENPAKSVQPARRKLPRSPFVAMPADRLDVNNAAPIHHESLTTDVQGQPQPRERGGQRRVRQGDRQGTADALQPTHPQSRLNINSRDQSEGRGARRARGASNGPSHGQKANGGQTQNRSNDKSQDAPKSQRSGRSKKKD